MKVEKVNRDCCCNNCNRANYTSKFTTKSVHTIYEVTIGNMAIDICDNCLNQLVGTVVTTLIDDLKE